MPFTIESGVKIETELGLQTLALFSDISITLRVIASSLARLAFQRPTEIILDLPGTEGGTMAFTYEADKPDFEFRVKLPGVDSEGNTIPDISIPTGQTLVVLSDDTLGLEITQDPLDPKRILVHVGEPNTDETPRPVTVSARLTRLDGTDVVPPGSNSGTVTVGQAVGDPTGIVLDMPTT